MTSYADSLKLRGKNSIMLCRGINDAGENFWLYLSAAPAAVKKIDSDYKHGKVVNFLEYGEIIKFGVSDEPPEDVKRHMEETYGFKDGS